jgi:glutamyl-Q tRNA(Asp) synthetase
LSIRHRPADAYVGRFAPSPTGALHAGSLVAALASWLDARAHGGKWLLRIEDLDPPREQPGAAESIVPSLARLGLAPDAPPAWQSQRHDRYEAALQRLVAAGLAYPCGCTRKEIADSQLRVDGGGLAAGEAAATQELVYPGTCRNGLAPGRHARAWRLRVAPGPVEFEDRWFGRRSQDVAREVGDFVLRRADGFWAYQLAVVVDDAAQGITDVVRGADLIASTPRQLVLQRALGLAAPRYLHIPVVAASDGQKLSKQTGATAIDDADPRQAIVAALVHLGLEQGITPQDRDPARQSIRELLEAAIRAWRERFVTPA